MEYESRSETVSVGNWMGTTLLMCIPVVNLILLLVWAFGGSTLKSKSNWAKAALLWMVIGIGIYVLIVVLFGVSIFGLFSNGYY